MKSFLKQIAATLVAGALILSQSMAVASSVDEYIQQLKHQDPQVRAKAAYELGCT